MTASKEERVHIPGPAGVLEVAFTAAGDGVLADRGYCAVVCHPHPLHGGAMDNKVVVTLVRAYRELGVPVARLNFRGVSASEGVHDHGVGEIDDLRAVVDWMTAQFGADKVLLAGFSFGTGVVSNLSQGVLSQGVGAVAVAVAHAVFVAPPVGRYNFAPVSGYPCPVCVVMGDQDELVDAQEVYRWAAGLRPLATVIRLPEATHFFHGQLVRLREELVAVLTDQLANG